MKYKIVFLDIDGTILTEDHQIPDSTKKAVSELKNKGVEVAIATGRSRQETIDIANELGIETMITYNGSYVEYKGETISKTIISNADVNSFLDMAKDCGGATSFFGVDKAYYTDVTHPVVREVLENYHFETNNPKNELSTIGDVLKIILYAQSPDEVEQYKSKFTQFKFVPWNTTFHCVDILPSIGSKAEGIKKLLNYLGISKEESVAFGDGENDIEMLSFVGVGVAMGNAQPSLVPHANFQTTNVDKDGIYHGLKRIGLI